MLVIIIVSVRGTEQRYLLSNSSGLYKNTSNNTPNIIDLKLNLKKEDIFKMSVTDDDM